MPKLAPAFALLFLLASPSEAKPPKAGARAAPASGPVGKAAACVERFDALCAAMQSCAKSAEDLGGRRCEAIDPGCAKLQGEAPFTRGSLEACVSGLRKLTCRERLDPAELVDLEQRVPECRAIAAAESAEARRRAASTATASR